VRRLPAHELGRDPQTSWKQIHPDSSTRLIYNISPGAGQAGPARKGFRLRKRFAGVCTWNPPPYDVEECIPHLKLIRTRNFETWETSTDLLCTHTKSDAIKFGWPPIRGEHGRAAMFALERVSSKVQVRTIFIGTSGLTSNYILDDRSVI
jgi:hypothetical protein